MHTTTNSVLPKSQNDKNSVSSGSIAIPIDPLDTGEVFEGIGSLSAGASSRLLIDYPEPQRSEVLDFLFKPGFGASLPHLKVEIGGEVNSTCGSEPTHQRTRDELNFQRGYEWWLMKEAKARRPNILLDALPWGAPGWIGTYFSQDMADYIANFIKGAKSAHNLDIHYTGIWNERMYELEWIKLLRKTLDANELHHVKIVAADLVDDLEKTWQIAGDMATDQDLDAAIDVLGGHYPKFQTTQAAKACGKPLWSSEDGPWSGDWEGTKAIAKMLNRNYVSGKMTKTITWSLVTSNYDVLRLPDSGMMRAKEPWSGHYELQPALWCIAHHNQFAEPGWHYLDKACQMLPGGGSVVALTPPDAAEVSVVIETIDADSSQTLVLNIAEVFSSRQWSLWKTNQDEWFVKVTTPESKDGTLTMVLEPNAIYSLTTTTGQGKGTAQPPLSQPFPIPYTEDFQTYEPGCTPRYFMDQVGTFEVVNRADGKGRALAQVLPAVGILWETTPDQFHPFTLIGDDHAKNYAVSVNAQGGDGVTLALIGRFGGPQTNLSSVARGYRFEITAGSGMWKLSTPDVTLAEGKVEYPADTWHKLELNMHDTRIFCKVNDIVLTEIDDTSYSMGLAGLAASYGSSYFDNFSLT